MNRFTGSQFRKLEGGVRIPAEALGLLSDSLGESGRVRSRQVANSPDSATTAAPRKMNKRAALGTVPIVVSERDRARFEACVSPEPNTGCWLWTGGVNGRGYGSFRINGKQFPAHRVALTIATGPIPSGHFACHKCDFPPCVNPAHLFVGTCLDNMRDMTRKGRGPTGDRNGSRTKPERSARGERTNTARLTAELVLAIRALRRAGATCKELGAQYGVSGVAISKVARRASWAHVKEVAS